MSDYDYDRESVVEEVEGVAGVRLSGPATLELTAWEDGDFQVVAFHSIDATYPFDAEARGEEQGLPFYRERISFSTVGDSEGWILHEVVRRTCGETGYEVVHSERVGGYTPNWPAPIEDDDYEDDGQGFMFRYPGRFA